MPPIGLTPPTARRVRDLLRGEGGGVDPVGRVPSDPPTHLVECGGLVSTSPVRHYDGTLLGAKGLALPEAVGTAAVFLAAADGAALTPGTAYHARRGGPDPATGRPVFWAGAAASPLSPIQVWRATINEVLTADTCTCDREDGSGAAVSGTCYRSMPDWTLAGGQKVWLYPRQTTSGTTVGTTWWMLPRDGGGHSADGTAGGPGYVVNGDQAWKGIKTFWDQIDGPAGIGGTLLAAETVTEQDFEYELTPAKLRLESADGRAVVAEVPDADPGPVELSLIVPGSADDGAGDLRLTAGDAGTVLSGGASVGNATDVSRVGTTFHEGIAFVAGFAPSDGTSGLPAAPIVYFGQQAVAWNSTLYVCRTDGLSGASLEGQSFDRYKSTLNGVDALRNVYRRGWLVSAASCPGPTTSPADGETLVWSSGGWTYGTPDPGEIATLDGGSF